MAKPRRLYIRLLFGRVRGFSADQLPPPSPVVHPAKIRFTGAKSRNEIYRNSRTPTYDSCRIECVILPVRRSRSNCTGVSISISHKGRRSTNKQSISIDDFHSSIRLQKDIGQSPKVNWQWEWVYIRVTPTARMRASGGRLMTEMTQ